jgi:hypothetical protein
MDSPGKTKAVGKGHQIWNLGGAGHGWKDNIKMDLKEVGYKGMECF